MIVELLSPYSYIIYPLVFFGFLGLATVSVNYHLRLRKFFIAFLITGLLISGLVNIRVSPFTNLNKYTPALDRTITHHKINLADSRDNELKIDDRAILGYATNPHIIYSDLERLPNQTLEKMGEVVLKDSIELRKKIEKNGTSRNYYFPPPTRHYRWNQSLLEKYEKFKSLKIYKITTTYRNESYSIKNRNKELLTEIKRDEIERFN